MIANPVRILEQTSVFTALGIRFWDPVLDRQIRDGLRATAWRETNPWPVVRAWRTRSDIYAFQGLPGLRDVEYGWQQASASPPAAQQRYIVQVQDDRGRFLPAALAIDLPLPYRGVFPAGAAHSPAQSAPSGFLLYSSVARPLPSWLTALRGELVDAASGHAAAHAVIRVQFSAGGRTWYGLSDEQGRFAVYLPYPDLNEPGSASPPLAPRPLSEQSWDLSVQVQYQPGQRSALAASALPDYLSILSQAPAALWQQAPAGGVSPVPQWAGTLEYGQELIITSTGLNHLLVSPAHTSP